MIFSALKSFWHKLGSPRWFFEMSQTWVFVLGWMALLLLAAGFVWAIAFAPADYQQGNSFRIMYVHVPAAMVAQSLYIGMGVAGFIGLVWRMKLTDVAIAASLPLGMLLTALALFTGSVWGRPTWNSWWEWDGRTVSTLVLFFLYVGIYALREAIPGQVLRARASAVIALVGMVNIPIIKFSVEWWHTLHQPASFTIMEKPAMPVEMWAPLLVMVLGFYTFAGFTVLSAMRLEILQREAGTAWVSVWVSGQDPLDLEKGA